MIHQFDEGIPVDTPLGKGYAIFIEAGVFDYWWTVVLRNRAIVTFTQDRIRVSRNYSLRLGMTDEEMKDIVEPKTK